MSTLQLPKGIHHCLERNPHVVYYQTPEVYLRELKRFDEELLAAVECTGELWTLQWYPDTPVGFFLVAGSSLEDVLRRAFVIGELAISE